MYWTSKVEHIASLTAVRFADPDFLLECKISAIWRRFPLILHFIFRMSAIFLLPVCLTYWPRKYTTRVDPHVDDSHQVWSPWWVMSDNVSHWLPLKMRTRPLRMRRITWLVSRGVKNNYIFGIPDPDLPIRYTTFIGLRWRLRGVYSRASPMLKPLTA